MNIGIVGSRRRNERKDAQLVSDMFYSAYSPGDTIISGGCPQGADLFAEIIAIKLAAPPGDLHDVNYLFTTSPHERMELIKKFKAPIKIFRPEWDKYGKYAPFYRNGLIAEAADILIACVAPDRKGGTENTIRKFATFHRSGAVLLC